MELTISADRRSLLAAAARLNAERGFAAVDIASITAAAGLSEADFYQHFESAGECLAAAQRTASEELKARMRKLREGQADFPELVLAGVAEGLNCAAQEPALAATLIPSAIVADRLLADGVWEMTEFLACGLRAAALSHPGAYRTPEMTEQVLVGGVQTLVGSELRAGRAAGLPGLATEIAVSILTPYLGAAAAARLVARGSETP